MFYLKSRRSSLCWGIFWYYRWLLPILEDRAMLESNLSAGLDSAAMRIGDEMFPFLFHCRRSKALNSWGGAPYILIHFSFEDTARRQINNYDDEQSDIRGFSHFIASSGELPRTYVVRLVCITNQATSRIRGFSFTHFPFASVPYFQL